MTGDGTHTYQWDAENRMVSVDGGSTATYKYNVLGQRVERFLPNGSWTFDYLFGVGGEELGLYNAGGATWFDQDVPMGRRILVMYGSPLRIVHANSLGTTTVVTDQTGTQLEDHLFYPWGQSWTGTGLGYDIRFAGMHQFESPELLYPTDFRKYNPALGRWMSPDPLGGDVTNPQSLNRYPYVLNNPTTLTDPLGLWTPGECDPFDPIDCGPPPCYFGDWNDCPPPCDPYFGCGYGGGGGGGRGGHGGHGGGGVRPPGAPPAGQPPLAGGSNGNRWVSPTLTPGESYCTRYGIPSLGGLKGTDMPCFVILVTSSATLGGNLSTSPGPGPRIESTGVVPTNNYWDYLGCVATVLPAKLFPNRGGAGVTLLLHLAPWAGRHANPWLWPVAAVYDLNIELQTRELCKREVYGEY